VSQTEAAKIAAFLLRLDCEFLFSTFCARFLPEILPHTVGGVKHKAGNSRSVPVLASRPLPDPIPNTGLWPEIASQKQR
jgi:hypothetical protein